MDERSRGDKQLLFSDWDRSAAPLPPPSRPGIALAERVRGMLLGLAIGDALGNTTEGQLPGERLARWGEVRDYLPNRYAASRRVGLPCQDTQLTFWTVESLLRQGELDPEDLASVFQGSRIYGAGSTIRGFLLILQMGGVLRRLSWCDAGQPSAGNGALMRIAPVVLPHVLSPTISLWDDVVCATALTHKDDAAITASAGLVGVLMELLASEEGHTPAPSWWYQTFVHYARPLEVGRRYETHSPEMQGVCGTLCDVVTTLVPSALDADLPTLEACTRWLSGGYLLETVPCVLYLLGRHADDPQEALVRAVNDTRDNDTIGSIVGAVVGALHGADALPERWRSGLLGRTRVDDDGHVQELTELAIQAFAGDRA